METIIFAFEEFARKALSAAETSSSPLLVKRTSVAGRIWASSCATARFESAAESPVGLSYPVSLPPWAASTTMAPEKRSSVKYPPLLSGSWWVHLLKVDDVGAPERWLPEVE
jgi:hypothetical protein